MSTSGTVDGARSVAHQRGEEQRLLVRLMLVCAALALWEKLGTLFRAWLRLGLVVLASALVSAIVVGQARVAALLVIPIGARSVIQEYRRFRESSWNLPWFGIVWCAIGFGSFMARYVYEAFPAIVLVAVLAGMSIWKFAKVRAVTLLMFGAVVVNLFAFVRFGMRGSDTCSFEPGVRPILGVCTVPAAPRADGVIMKPSAFQQFFAVLPGAPPLGEFEYSPREAVLCADGKAVCAVFGHPDQLVKKSAALKIDLATHEVVGTLWVYSASALRCSDRHGLCAISSEQANRVYLVEQDTWRVLREYQLNGLMPGFQVELDPDVDRIAILLLAGSGIDPARVPTYGPVVAVEHEVDEDHIGVLDLGTLDFVAKPIRGALPQAFAGDARLFASYDSQHDLFVVGSALAAVKMKDMTVLVATSSLVEWYLGHVLTGGAVVDPESGTLYANHPFGGVAAYRVRDDAFQELGRIPMTMGGRPLERDSRRGWLYSGNYDRGYVEVIDPHSREIRARWTVGRRVRTVHFHRGRDPGNDRLVVTSVTGICVIDVAEALGERARSMLE